MKLRKKFFLFVLAAVTALCMAFGFAACGEKEEPKTATYTVSVVCDEAEVLDGVQVSLSKDGNAVQQKPLENGKATFELEAGSYTVSLTGVPENYSYEPKTLTESAPSATITLTKKDAEPQKTVYTVTVTCEDEAVLAGLKVRLMKGGEVKAEKPLENGKATFELETDAYTAVLTGAPADYTYESASLTANAPSATIALTKKTVAGEFKLTVSVSAGSDVFGNEHEETLLAGARVELFASEADLEPVAAATTDETGVATFESLKAGEYLANVDGKDCGNVIFTEGENAKLSLAYQHGSADAPLVWTVGENDLPFTKEILSSLGDDGYVYASLTVEESGLYSFDSDCYNANVTSEAFMSGLIGTTDHVTAELTAGTRYLFQCTSSGSDESGFGYKVTVTKGNTQGEGGDTPSVPWTGAGVETDPYVITTLKGEYRVQIKYENGAYTPVWFKYTETAAAKYAIYSSDQNFYLTVGEKHYSSGGDSSSETSLFETAASSEYLFVLSPYDEDGTETLTVSFTVGDYDGWLPKWAGSGRFRMAQPQFGVEGIDDPYIIETLTDDYDVMVGNDGVYFKYAATETKNYKISATGDYSFSFGVRDYNNGSPVREQQFTVKLGAEQSFTLTADKTYLFYVSANNDSAQMEVWKVLLSFKIEEGSAVVDPVEPDGSQDNPFPLDPVLGDHNDVDATSEGVWFSFTATEDADYVFALKSAGWLVVNGKDLYSTSKTVTLTVATGKSYTLCVKTWGGDEKGKVSYSVTKKSNEPDGSKERPFLLEGELLGDHSIAVEKTVYYKYTLAEDMTIVVTSKSAMTLTIGGKSLIAAAAGATQTFELKAGEIVLKFEKTGSATTAEFTVEKATVYPWAGKGTKEDPFLIENLIGEYNDIKVVYLGDDKFENVYFKYSPKQDVEYYTVTLTVPADAVITFTGAKSAMGQTIPFVNAAAPENYSANLKLTKGTDLIICVSGGNDVSQTEEETYETFTCSFKIEEYQLPEPETGSAQKPDPLTELLGTHSVTTETAYYFVYTATADGKYYVSSDYQYGITFTVRDSLALDSYGVPTGKKLYDISLSAGDKGVFELTSGKTYYFSVKSNLISEGAVMESFSFTIEEYVAGEPDGTQANPFPLENVFGEHTFNVDGTGLYYSFELEEKTDVTITALTKYFYLEINGGTRWMVTNEGAVKNYTLVAGTNTLHVYNAQGGTSEVKIKIEKVGGSGPVSGGTADAPEKLDALEGSYTRPASYKDGWYMEFTANEKVIYTFVAKSGSMSVQFGDKQKGTISVSGGVLSYIAEAGQKYTVVIFGSKMTTDNVVFEVQKLPMPDYPWDGEGTQETPYVLTEDSLLDVWVDSTTGLFFKYVAGSDAELTFAPQTTKVAIVLSDRDWGNSGNLATNKWVYIGDPADSVRTLSLTKGETLIFSVGLQSGKNLTNHKVQFTVKSTEPEIEGSGTSDDPEILKNLDQTITRNVASYSTNYYFQFTATENKILTVSAETYCMIGGNNPFANSAINANASVSAQLTAGTTYKFWVRPASPTAPLDMVIVFSTSEAPDIPWSGEGTQSSPYQLQSLTGNYKVFAKGSAYLYFSYTAEKNATYRVTPKSVTAVTFYLTPQTILFEQSQKYNYNSSKFDYDEFYLPAGTQLTLRLYPSATAIYEFEIEEVATKTNYTVTVNGADKDVYGNTINEAAKSGVEVSLMNGEQVVETKTTGADGTVTFSQPKGDYTVKIGEESYELTENAATVTLDSGIVYGVKEHPLTIELGETIIPLTQDLASAGGVYYAFTPTTNATYIFGGSGAGIWYNVFTDGDKFEAVGGFAALSGTVSPVELKLESGTVYLLQTMNTGTAGYAPYTIKIEVKSGTAEATPDDGFHFGGHDYTKMMVGTWKTADGYTMTITETTFLLTGPDGAKCSYTLTETADTWNGYLYSLSWNGKTYDLDYNHDTGPTGGLVLYDEGNAAYTFAPSASGEVEATFPQELQGSWKCQATEDEDEDVSNVPNLVIGEHSVTWGEKTVKILAESAGSYLLEIDGVQWTLLANISEFNTMLMLHSDSAGVTYRFSNAGAGAEE